MALPSTAPCDRAKSVALIACPGVSLVVSSVLTYMMWDHNAVGMAAQMNQFDIEYANFKSLFFVIFVGLAVWFVATLIMIRINITKLLRGEYL